MNYKLQTSSNMHQQAQSRTSSKQETKYEQVQNKKYTLQTTSKQGTSTGKHKQAQARKQAKANKQVTKYKQVQNTNYKLPAIK